VIRDGLINEIRVRFAQQPRLYKNVLIRQEGILDRLRTRITPYESACGP
jgi:hypothetical protein